MKFVSLWCVLSAAAFAVPTIAIENVPARTDAASLDFDVVVMPDGFPDYAPVVETSGPTALTPVLRSTPATGATRFEYRLNFGAALPGRYQIIARTPGPNEQNIYTSVWFVYRSIPTEPLVTVNVKEGDVVGPVFWLFAKCENCATFNGPPQGWTAVESIKAPDGKYRLRFEYTGTDNQYRAPIEINVTRGAAKLEAPAAPEVPVEAESCSSAGLLMPLLALLWFWRRRGVVVLGLALTGCPTEIVQAGEGAENVEPLWPAHAGWRYGKFRITDRWKTDRGDAFFLQHDDSGGQTYVEDAQGIWQVGSEYAGELEKPLLIVPKKTKLGATWRTRAKLNTPKNLVTEFHSVSSFDVWQMSVVANHEVTTPWGRRRMWVIGWVGPPRVGSQPSSSDETPMPRLKGSYAFIEGVGPITYLPNLGWPREVSWSTPNSNGRPIPENAEGEPVLAQLDDSSTWELPSAPMPDETGLPTATLGEPIFTKDDFAGAELSLIVEPSRTRLRIDGTTLFYSNTGGFNPEGNTGGVTGYYATPTTLSFDVTGEGVSASELECPHGTSVITTDGVLHVLPKQSAFGYATSRIESGLVIGYNAVGATPANGVVASVFTADDSSSTRLGGFFGPVEHSDLEGPSCTGRFTGFLEWKSNRFGALCREADRNGVATALVVKQVPPVALERREVGFTQRLETNGPLGYRVAPGKRTLTTISHHGLLRRVEWSEVGIRFEELARITPPAGVRLRSAVQLNDDTWLVMGVKGSSFMDFFSTPSVPDQYGVTSHEVSTAPGTLMLWTVKLSVTPRVGALPLSDFKIGTQFAQQGEAERPFLVCWPDGAATVQLGPVTPSTTSEHCGEVPRFELPDGTFFMKGTAPRVGEFSVMLPSR